MDIVLIFLGPLLAIVAVMVGRTRGRRPVASLILGAAPLALVGVAAPLLRGTYAFLSGFTRLAAQGTGGAGLVSEPCLAIARPIFMGSLVALATLLCVSCVALLHQRHDPPPDVPQAPPPLSLLRGASIAALSALPVAGLAAVAGLAERMARLTMLMVDPSRQSEAQAAVGSMDVSRVSSFLATGVMRAIAGGLAVTLLLAVAGPAAAFAVRPVERHRVVRAGAWIFLAAVALLLAWHLNESRALSAWFAGVR